MSEHESNCSCNDCYSLRYIRKYPDPQPTPPAAGPFSKGYKHRHGQPVSDACGDGKHAECTQDFTKCNCTVRGGHTSPHAYMNFPPPPAARETLEASQAALWRDVHKVHCWSDASVASYCAEREAQLRQELDGARKALRFGWDEETGYEVPMEPGPQYADTFAEACQIFMELIDKTDQTDRARELEAALKTEKEFRRAEELCRRQAEDHLARLGRLKHGK